MNLTDHVPLSGERGKLTTMCRTLVTVVAAIIISITQVRAWDADVGGLAFGVLWLACPLSCVF